MLYRFAKSDILHSTLKTYPKSKFHIYDRHVYYNNQPNLTESGVKVGSISLYGINPGGDGSYITPFVYKDSDFNSFKITSNTDYNIEDYGNQLDGTYNLSASLTFQYFALNGRRGEITSSLRNALNYYSILAPDFLDTFETQPVMFVGIPAMFYGSTIKKGSVVLKTYISGVLAAVARDSKQNGQLIETYGPVASTGYPVGVVMYDHGFLLLTGTWDINGHGDHKERYATPWAATDFPKWQYFGTTGSTTPHTDLSNCSGTVFQLEFDGMTNINTLTMFARANRGELNHSNNPTYLSYGQTKVPATGSNYYREYPEIGIKNIVTSSFDTVSGTFYKQTFISRIAIYDENKNVIAIAKLATPVRKREKDAFTFKLKLDL